jgi:hypothetical protein
MFSFRLGTPARRNVDSGLAPGNFEVCGGRGNRSGVWACCQRARLVRNEAAARWRRPHATVCAGVASRAGDCWWPAGVSGYVPPPCSRSTKPCSSSPGKPQALPRAGGASYVQICVLAIEGRHRRATIRSFLSHRAQSPCLIPPYTGSAPSS